MKASRILCVICALFLFFSHRSVGQQAALPDRAQWTTLSRDSSSRYFYPRLLQRFLDADTALTNSELVLLNHGYTLQASYDPYGQSMTEDTLYDCIKQQEYEKALEIGHRYLRTNPVSLRGNLAMMLAFKHLDSLAEQMKYRTHVSQLLRSVLSAGSGRSADSAFVVINVSDEYTILDYLGYAVNLQSLISGRNGRSYDMMNVTAREDTTDNRVFYFDVTAPLESLSKQINGK